MAVCCCILAGTAACQHCQNNPMATDVWTNKTVTVDRVEAKPFGNGIDVCPVCGKPSTIGKPMSHYDQIRSMSVEEMADFVAKALYGMLGGQPCLVGNGFEDCKNRWLDWLRDEEKE